ncbi:hypothetical protein QUF31_00465 [Dickeya chrysanthemi]|uniref:hypothetical protein n=1 Tax=Dickeya chrysanthemi TaxID=556 RepID=UPI0025A21998|nr:hypothetical protein [Dickeya chrysanthemi]WJM85643.1 hypothetical protein QUF31_00465 [Dickeya chrysanthemi]
MTQPQRVILFSFPRLLLQTPLLQTPLLQTPLLQTPLLQTLLSAGIVGIDDGRFQHLTRHPRGEAIISLSAMRCNPGQTGLYVT